MRPRRWLALTMTLLMLLSAMPTASATLAPDGTFVDPATCSHSWMIDPGRDATCTESGSYYRFCTKCGKGEQVVTPALGHAWMERTVSSKEATCTEAGYREYYRICSRCGIYEGASAVGTVPSPKRETYPALGHSFGPYHPDPPATCTESGKDWHTCQRCGYKEWQYLEVLGHLWDSGVVTRQPSPELPGEITFTCQRDPSHTYTEEIPYTAGPTVAPTAFLELSVLQTSPGKAAYALGEEITFTAILKNASSITLYDASIERYDPYTAQGFEQVFYPSGSYSPSTPFPAGESFSWPFSYTITQEDVDRSFVMLAWIGSALKLASGEPVDTAPQIVELPTTADLPEKGAIELNVTQTSPAKTAYALGEEITFDVVMTNVGPTMLYEPASSRFDSYTAQVKEVFFPGGSFQADIPFPSGDSFTGKSSYVITQEDVDRGEVTLGWDGHAWEDVTAEPGFHTSAIYPEIVYITLPTTKEPPQQNAVSLSLTMTKIGPDKAAYAAEDWVDYQLTLANNGAMDMKHPGFCYFYFNENGQKVEYIHWNDVSHEVLHAGEALTVTVSYPIGEYVAKNRTFQMAAAQGFADIPEGAFLSEDQIAEYASEGRLYTDTCSDELPILQVAGEAALVLSVVQTSPVKPVYQLDDPISWKAILTNAGSVSIELPVVTRRWEEGNASSSYTSSVTLAPGEDFVCEDYDSIISEDVANGTLTFSFIGRGYREGTDEEVLSNEVSLSWPTEDQPLPPVVPPEGAYQLHLDVQPMYPKTKYEVDGMGDTEEIPYVVSVTNMGDWDVEFEELLVYFGSSNFMHYEPTQYLKPAETYTFPVYGTVLNEADINPGSATAETLGVVTVSFRAYGLDPDSGKEVCFSNEVTLDHTLYEFVPWTPEDSSFDVEKIEVSTPAVNPNGYMLNETIEYDIIVTNTGDVTVPSVEVHDYLGNIDYSQLIAELHDMAPGESRTVHFTYTVQQIDVDQKYVMNLAFVVWTVPATGEETFTDSYPVYSPTTSEPPTGTLEVEKSVVGDPDNGLYYVPGESIEFNIVVTNTMDVPINAVEVADYNEWEYVGLLLPHASYTFSYFYEVTELDADMGYVTNVAWGEGVTDYGMVYAISNEVTVPAHREPPKLAALKVTKTESSKPANGVYYKLGEEITYTITVENIGEDVLYDVALYDSLDDWMKGDFAHVGILKPGEKRSFPYKYTVTQDDVDWTYVENYVVADFWAEQDGATYSEYAGPVYSPTGEKTIFPPKPPVKTEGKGDSCKLTLTAVGAYTIAEEQHFCQTHKRYADQADALTAQAVGKAAMESAWQQSAQIWRRALEEQYASMLNAAVGKARIALLEEKLTMDLYLASLESLLRQLYPNDLIKAYKAMSDFERTQCSELCYLQHNASKTRPDSLFTGRFTALTDDQAAAKCASILSAARSGETKISQRLCEEHGAVLKTVVGLADAAANRAGAEDAFKRARRLWQSNLDRTTNLHYRAADAGLRQVIAQNRTLFDGLMARREAVLEQFYPNNSEIVAEVLSSMMRGQVLAMCEIW